jgi:predicted metal-dependent peptidase
MKDKQAHDQLVKARTALLLDHFFFGRLSLYLKLTEEPGIPTLAVDGKHIFYNPEFVKTLSHALTMSAIAHEIGHCIFEHIIRRGGRDPKIWNMAGDYIINDIIKQSGFQIGESWLHDVKYRGMYAEHVYDLLAQQNGGKGPGQGQMGGAGGLCEVRDAAGPGEQADMAETAMEWKIAVTQAADGAKKAGRMPAGMERFVEEITTPKVPWREVLARFINQVAKDDYQWSRPNRRYLSAGLYLPSLHSERMGEIVVVIDTSGSIDQPTLNAFGSEIQAIVAASRPEKTRVVYCDAKVNHVDEFSPEDQLVFKMHGGGGTDFRPPFAMIDDEDTKPVALVYLTDMYGSFPREEPEFPVLWCATSDIVGPFGDTLRINV